MLPLKVYVDPKPIFLRLASCLTVYIFFFSKSFIVNLLQTFLPGDPANNSTSGWQADNPKLLLYNKQQSYQPAMHTLSVGCWAANQIYT